MNSPVKSFPASVSDRFLGKCCYSISLTKLCLIGASALACISISQQTNADTFVCNELKAVVAEAENQFISLKSDLVKKETTADFAKAQGISPDELDMSFESRTYATKTILVGADKCHIVQVFSEDEDAKIEQISFICNFDKTTTLTKATREELSQCISGEEEGEPEDDEFVSYVNRVESGEGYSGTSVEAVANAIDGLKISINGTTCMNLKAGGCER